MPNGDGQLNGGEFNYWDATYNGSGATTTDSAPLSGGLGVLTDGFVSPDPWNSVSNLSGTGPYVGWQWRNNGDPTIAFNFAGPVRVNTISLAVDNTQIGGVFAPVALTIDGTTYTPTVTAISATSEWLTVSGLLLAGSTLTVTPDHDPHGASMWMFVSEAQFTGGAVPEPSTWAMMLLALPGSASLAIAERSAQPDPSICRAEMDHHLRASASPLFSPRWYHPLDQMCEARPLASPSMSSRDSSTGPML